MRSVIKTAKTVDEAVELGLQELNGEREYAQIEVLEEPKAGFLGLLGGKDAVVKITVTDNHMGRTERFLKEILEKMHIVCDLKIEEVDGNIQIEIIAISDEDTGIVIGRRGETLDALQYLVNLVLNRHTDSYTRVLIDIGGYRSRREESLKRLAEKMAIKAKKYRKPMRLEPMNPYERRIIHSAVQSIQGVNTTSEGEDPYRRVIIRPNR